MGLALCEVVRVTSPIIPICPSVDAAISGYVDGKAQSSERRLLLHVLDTIATSLGMGHPADTAWAFASNVDNRVAKTNSFSKIKLVKWICAFCTASFLMKRYLTAFNEQNARTVLDSNGMH